MEWVQFDTGGGLTPAEKYALLERLGKCARRREVSVLGFGLGRRAAFILEGDGDDIANTVIGVKVGTVRQQTARRRALRLGPTMRIGVRDLTEALASLHRIPLSSGAGPLASPWSSHRDLLGFRAASFYDPAVLSGRVDARCVHLAAGGGPLPHRPPEDPGLDLSLTYRVAAAVLGRLPGSRSCHRLFTHMARACGARQEPVADALMLTTRRIRQLLAEPEPLLRTGLIALGDPRLCAVP